MPAFVGEFVDVCSGHWSRCQHRRGVDAPRHVRSWVHAACIGPQRACGCREHRAGARGAAAPGVRSRMLRPAPRSLPRQRRAPLPGTTRQWPAVCRSSPRGRVRAGRHERDRPGGASANGSHRHVPAIRGACRVSRLSTRHRPTRARSEGWIAELPRGQALRQPTVRRRLRAVPSAEVTTRLDHRVRDGRPSCSSVIRARRPRDERTTPGPRSATAARTRDSR